MKETQTNDESIMNSKQPTSTNGQIEAEVRHPDPLYKSNVYYAVVIRFEEYKGWECHLVNRPTMHFRKGSQEIRITSPELEGWMEYCWNKFLEDIKE